MAKKLIDETPVPPIDVIEKALEEIGWEGDVWKGALNVQERFFGKGATARDKEAAQRDEIKNTKLKIV